MTRFIMSEWLGRLGYKMVNNGEYLASREVAKGMIKKSMLELAEKDKEVLDKNDFKGLDSEQQAIIYSELRRIHIEEASKLFNEAWQTYDMLRVINSNEALEISDAMGYMGFAHKLLSKQYESFSSDLRRTSSELGKLEKSFSSWDK